MDATQNRLVPYQQEGEPPRRAALARVGFDLSSVSDEDLQVVGHLIDAVDLMNPIFRHQVDPDTFAIRRLVGELVGVAEGEDRQALQHYLTVLDVQNGPYASLPTKSHLLAVPRERLLALAKRLGRGTPARAESVIDRMTRGRQLPVHANFYPADISEQEFTALGSEATRVNSSVVRDASGRPAVVLNERRYRDALLPILDHLRAARDLTTHIGLRLYLDAKVLELEAGSEEARRVADAAWIRSDSPLDLVLSTAIEVYLDRYKNARGAAAGAVSLLNQEAEQLLRAIIQRVPRFESTAPWTFKRESVDPSRLPRLKFVDVLAWSGDYIGSPFTTLAQSLPNDEWIVQNLGAVNMVFVNTTRVVVESTGRLQPDEFLTRQEADLVRPLLFSGYQTHSALHEIGHSTGRMDEAHSAGQPRDYLETEYSSLEETRAELFGLWALRLLTDDGVVSSSLARASYDSMLLIMVHGLRFVPDQAHTIARSAIYHDWESKGVVRQVEEGGKRRFALDHARVHDAVAEMLKTVGDLRSTGDKVGATALRERLVFTDPLKDEIERRTADLPLGLGLIFPRLKTAEGRYTRELVYPERFEEQPKFGYEIAGSEPA